MQPKRAFRLTDLPQLASLKHADFRYTWLAGMCSGAAMWTFIISSAWLVFDASGSSARVGVITFASMIPFLIASPVGGLLGDAFDRRRLTAAMFAFAGVVAIALAALAASGRIEIWHVALFAFASGAVKSIQEPAMASLIPNQVPRDDLLNALVLNSATRHGARFFGLLVAAPLIGSDALGAESVLVLSAAFQAVGAALMMRVKTVSTGETKAEHSAFKYMVNGMAYIYSNHALALFIILVAFHCALVMSFESMMPAFSRETLGAAGDWGALVFNYLMMSFGAGSLVGMMALAGVRDDRAKGRFLLITSLASALTPILLALSPNVGAAMLFAGAMGAFQATFMALTNTYVQIMAPDRLRARISSLYILHAGGIMAFANLGYGFMADSIGAPSILIVTGLLFLAAVAALAANQPILRRVYQTGQVVPA